MEDENCHKFGNNEQDSNGQNYFGSLAVVKRKGNPLVDCRCIRRQEMHDHKNTEMVFMISLKKKNTTTTVNLSSQHQRDLVVMTRKAAGKRIQEWEAFIPTIMLQ